ncbi:hypothetical protein DMENIID0001_136270 [Sergentomyia squamirostris]
MNILILLTIFIFFSSSKESLGVNIVGPFEFCGSENKYRIFRAGYITHLGRFHEVYKTCYDSQELTPFYTVHMINSVDEDKFYDNGFFYNRNFYKIDINELYRNHTGKFMSLIPHQYEHFCGPRNYLERSHLTPRADFKMEEDQCVIEHHINTVPHFSSFIKGPWFQVEKFVRDKLAGNRNTTVITGVFGILQLDRQQKNLAPLELYLGEKVLPVPGLLWKVVIYHVGKYYNAVIFLGNIFSDDPVLSICHNICKNIEFQTVPGISCCYLYNLVEKDEKLDADREKRLFRDGVRKVLLAVKEIREYFDLEDVTL